MVIGKKETEFSDSKNYKFTIFDNILNKIDEITIKNNEKVQIKSKDKILITYGDKIFNIFIKILRIFLSNNRF